MKNLTIAILCGGKSSRMQTEKGLVLYQGKPFIEWVIEAALPISNSIQLITNSDHYDYLGYKKNKDVVEDQGPVGGIYTALFHSKTGLNLILSCDIPLISTEILLELIQKHKNNDDATVFGNSRNIHPLIGIYSKKSLPILKNAIEENELKMMHLLPKLNHQIIAIDDDKNIFFRNINTLNELKELNFSLLQ